MLSGYVKWEVSSKGHTGSSGGTTGLTDGERREESWV